MEDYLYQKKFYFFLLGKKLNLMSKGECEILDSQVLGVVRLSLVRNVVFNIKKRGNDRIFVEVVGKNVREIFGYEQGIFYVLFV